MGKKLNMSGEQESSAGKLVHLALPVRWSLAGQSGRSTVEAACTYDIHSQGARLLSSRPVNVGDLVLVERGRNKAMCQVIWTANPESSLRGQFTVQCVEGKAPWDDELRQMEEQFQPLILDSRFGSRTANRLDQNRRRRPRFFAQGEAEVIDRIQRKAGEIEQISEYGARLSAIEPLRPGSEFRLILNLCDVSLALKAQVKYLVSDIGMGVEFQEIRLGDRPLLSYVLSKLKSTPVEDFVPVEVVSETLGAAAR